MNTKVVAANTDREANDGSICDGSDDNADRNRSSNSNNTPDATNNDQCAAAHPALVPLDIDSPLHMLKVFCNELLHEVFMRSNFIDLLNVAKVCTRFQSQAHAVFASKYASLVLHQEECDHEKMESILCEFGSLIQSLQIVSNEAAAGSDVFHAIIQNCSRNLKVLNLVNVYIHVESPNFRLPFPNLEELRLSHCQGNISLAHLVDDCPELKIIDVLGPGLGGINGLIDRGFMNLEQLHLSDNRWNIDDDALESFITMNPQLIELHVSACSVLETSRPIRLIGQNLLNLKELTFDMGVVEMEPRDMEYIANLRSLNKLWLNFNDLDVEPLIRALVKNDVPIQRLSFIHGSFDDNALRSISQLKQLKDLQIQYGDDLIDDHLIGLAKNLQNLQVLKLWVIDNVVTLNGITEMLRHAEKLNVFELGWAICSAIINEDVYYTMLDIIQNRPEKIGLRMKISGELIKVNVPDEILLENRSVLAIEYESHVVDDEQ